MRPTSQEVPPAVLRARPTGHVRNATALQISISLEPAYPLALEAYADAVSDPLSPDYGRFLSPSEVGRRFGASPERVQEVTEYLQSQGMRVTLVGENRLTVLAEATAAQAERAFATTLRTYRQVPQTPTDRAEFFAYAETPQLPAAIASKVVHIGGLEDSTRPVPRSLTAAQTRSVYKAASLYNGGFRGEGRNIAVSNFDGFRLSNLPLYYSQFNLPAPTGGVGSNVRVVTCGTGAATGRAQGEGDLDIQMVLGVAPLCNLTVYDGTDLLAVLTRETNDNSVEIISESYGWKLSTSGANAAHNLHLAMSAQGITYLAASGDYGTDFKGYDYPDYEPEVLQVGGTIATATALGTRATEVGWSGSGGGYSTNAASFNTLPSWQKGTGVPTSCRTSHSTRQAPMGRTPSCSTARSPAATTAPASRRPCSRECSESPSRS
jgi:subtilase family serine protease